jgi:hypothetical protein
MNSFQAACSFRALRISSANEPVLPCPSSGTLGYGGGHTHHFSGFDSSRASRRIVQNWQMGKEWGKGN